MNILNEKMLIDSKFKLHAKSSAHPVFRRLRTNFLFMHTTSSRFQAPQPPYTHQIPQKYNSKPAQAIRPSRGSFCAKIDYFTETKRPDCLQLLATIASSPIHQYQGKQLIYPPSSFPIARARARVHVSRK